MKNSSKKSVSAGVSKGRCVTAAGAIALLWSPPRKSFGPPIRKGRLPAIIRHGWLLPDKPRKKSGEGVGWTRFIPTIAPESSPLGREPWPPEGFLRLNFDFGETTGAIGHLALGPFQSSKVTTGRRIIGKAMN